VRGVGSGHGRAERFGHGRFEVARDRRDLAVEVRGVAGDGGGVVARVEGLGGHGAADPTRRRDDGGFHRIP
jgi:hypothetical protein